MKQPWSWFLQPFPLELDWRRLWMSLALGVGFVTFFLFMFRPFGMQDLSAGKAFNVAISFGLVTGLATVIWFSMVRYLHKAGLIREENWTSGKEILADLGFIIFVGMANMVYSSIRFSSPITLETFIIWQKLTFLVGLFPTIFGVLLKQIRLMKHYSNEATILNASISGRESEKSGPNGNALRLLGDNQNEELIIPADSLYYVSAADNYVQVYYRKEGSLESTMLRSTLKKIEGMLTGQEAFFRCHRTYLVNLNKVNGISGNAQGFKLELEGIDDPIPVSRSLNKSIHQHLQAVQG